MTALSAPDAARSRSSANLSRVIFGFHPSTEAYLRRRRYASVDGWNPKMTRERLAELRDLAASGALRAVIDRCYPLAELVEAHRYVETRRKKGNVVIDVA